MATWEEVKQSNLLSREWRLDHLYYILDKNKKCILFKRNPNQKKILDHKRKCMLAWLPYKMMTLKARQGGITTEECIYDLDQCLFYPNQDNVIIAHSMDKAQDIFRIIKFAYDKLPQAIEMADGRIWTKPIPEYDSKSEYFFPSLNSRIKVVKNTRSITPSICHITELAYLEDAENEMAAIDGSLWPGASLSIETTANGMTWAGKFFYEEWKKNFNVDGAPYKCFFFAWWSMDDYESKTPLSALWAAYSIEKGKYVDSLTMILEKEWFDSATIERKISWYIQKARTNPKVEQDFPSTPEEAFLTSSRPVFDLPYVVKLRERSEELGRNRINDSFYKELFFYDYDENFNPIPCKDVVLGTDVAEGLLSGDYTTIVWRRKSDLKLLFTYRAHIKPKLVAGVYDRIFAYWYEIAGDGLGIERNNHGIAVIDACENFDWNDKLYVEKTQGNKYVREMKKYGWRTWANKVMMLEHLDAAIREGRLTELAPEEFVEFFTFMHNEDGTMGALKPDHDDMIMGDTICIQMSRLQLDSIQ